MRGHSRGEWYATQKDIVNSDEDADYWALFGVTLGGHKHCLGEFTTKAEALVAQKDARLLAEGRRSAGARLNGWYRP